MDILYHHYRRENCAVENVVYVALVISSTFGSVQLLIIKIINMASLRGDYNGFYDEKMYLYRRLSVFLMIFKVKAVGMLLLSSVLI